MGWKDSFVAFDTETTGLGDDAKIVEIAIARFEKLTESNEDRCEFGFGVVNGYAVTDTFSTLLNPGPSVDMSDSSVVKAMEVNRIDPMLLDGKPTFSDVKEEVMRSLFGGPVVAHNFRFDWRMIRNELRSTSAGLECEYPVPIHLDTLMADFGLSPGRKKRSLSEVCKRWSVEVREGHRALIDSVMCGQVAAQMMPLLPDGSRELCCNVDAWTGDWDKMVRKFRR
jgi:DNA polymerase III epsilon subunit-like protein